MTYKLLTHYTKGLIDASLADLGEKTLSIMTHSTFKTTKYAPRPSQDDTFFHAI